MRLAATGLVQQLGKQSLADAFSMRTSATSCRHQGKRTPLPKEAPQETGAASRKADALLC
jgi:hypothetical protein